MTEAFLQYVWRYQLYDKPVYTVDGRFIRVVSCGTLNRDAGPDFQNAHLVIDNVEWIGNVEIHVKSSDWIAHGHSSDCGYNNVVLHVVYDDDAQVRLENGQMPLTLCLQKYLSQALIDKYSRITSVTEGEQQCISEVQLLPPFMLNSFFERLLVERVEEKATTVRRLLDESRGGWEQTCYLLMAHYFGGRVNALPFELLAKSVDMRLLARWKDNPTRVEALLMGQAGLLDGYFTDDYPRALQADYEALRQALGLKPIDGYLWKFYCLRPSSFPTIRISQFAHLVCEVSGLFSKMLQTVDVDHLLQFFNQTASNYWDNHYQFDKPNTRHFKKHIGDMQAVSIIINAWVPLLFVYGQTIGKQQYKEQAIELLNQLKPEANRITRKWSRGGLECRSAAQSQALIQLENNYCANRRCLDCQIGYFLLKKI
ncbi:MAG: DUF2851 family protein [Bacteroidales bacterium]|nr:DUF2851 family protein [Bacteroidales bacterium]MBR1799851.1 DUF2851 family protein [Bacteroidales bacterium]MBR1850715.1 DUF2851 family protein [Bacteroidales bacterium]